MRYRWISWYHDSEMGEFELHSPWWVSGEDMAGRKTIVAAIPTDSEQVALDLVIAAYDRRPVALEIRFNDEKEGSPFSGRFRAAPWMKWPGGIS
jgi:hypothetical protein